MRHTLAIPSALVLTLACVALAGSSSAQTTTLAPFERAELRAQPGLALDRFGASVSISGDTAFVGAPREGVDDRGAAYVYQRTGQTWTLRQQLLVRGPGWPRRVRP